MLHIRVFISSPGDVGDERQLALRAMERLALEAEFWGKVRFEAVAWDAPGQDVPMRATMTPQEAINCGMPRPSQCDVVACILWSRLGTPLPSEYRRPEDGSRYLSGTEYEYDDAVRAHRESGKPDILVYRRDQDVSLKPGDPGLTEKLEQWQRVKDFFKRFSTEEGSLIGGVNIYRSPGHFAEKFETHVRKLSRELLAAESAGAGLKMELRQKPFWEGSPYMGLQPFDTRHSILFYGRDAALDDLVARMRETEERAAPVRFIAVVGASGSGKSSLVAAGLLPRVARGALEGSADWVVCRLRPGDDSEGDPCFSLARALAAAMPTLKGELLDDRPNKAWHLSNPKEVGPLLEKGLSRGKPWSKLLLFVDQFEEIFARVTAGSRSSAKISRDSEDRISLFIGALACLARSGRANVIVTLRADFYHEALEIPELSELMNQGGVYSLPQASSSDLAQMITRPAPLAGVRFEEGLEGRILEAALKHPGALPLLEYALDLLYFRRNPEGVMTTEVYEDFGGVEGAIGKRAEEIFKNLPPMAQESLPEVFSPLTLLRGDGLATRRRAEFRHFTGSEGALQLAEAFSSPNVRLLLPGMDDAGVKTLEVAHEALFSSWDRLGRWIEENREILKSRTRISVAAGDWIASGRDPAFLFSEGKPLAEALSIREVPNLNLDETERAFIEASIAKSRRRARLRFAAVASLAVLTLLALVAAWIANDQKREAKSQRDKAEIKEKEAVEARKETEEQRRTAVEQEKRSRAEANYLKSRWEGESLNRMAEMAFLLESFSLFPSQAMAEGIWEKRLKSPRLIWTSPTSGFPGKAKSCLDTAGGTSLVVSGDVDGVLQVWDFHSGAEIHRFQLSSSISSVSLSLDGCLLAAGSDNGTVGVWNTVSWIKKCDLDCGHEAVTSVSFGPNGSSLVSGSSDSSVRIWNIDKNECVKTMRHNGGKVSCVDFSPCGDFVATGGKWDCTIRLWEVSSGAEIARMQDFSKPLNNFDGGSKEVRALAFSPDGRFLAASAKSDEPGVEAVIGLWESRTGKKVFVRMESNTVIHCIDFSLDGKKILAGAGNGRIQVLHSETGAIQDLLSGHRGRILGIRPSPDASGVLSCSEDGTLRRFGFGGFGQSLVFEGHREAIQCLAVSPDGKRIASGSEDQTVRFWDACTGNLLTRTEEPPGFDLKPVMAIAFSRDGCRLAAGRGSTDEWVGNVVNIYHAATGAELMGTKEEIGPVYAVALDPSGRFVATGSGDNLFNGEYYLAKDSTVRIWNSMTGDLLYKMDGHEEDVKALAFSNDGSLLASGDKRGSIILWKTATGERLKSIEAGHGPVLAVGFCAGDRSCISSSADSVCVWDVDSGRRIGILKHGAICAVSFSRSGDFCLSFKEGSLGFFSSASLRQISRIDLGGTAACPVALGGEAEIIVASTDKALIRVYDKATGKERGRFQRHSGKVGSVSFDASGRRIASASSSGSQLSEEDCSIRFWDSGSGKCVAKSLGFRGDVQKVVFSPDGKFAAGVDAEGEVLFWDTSSGARVNDFNKHEAQSVFKEWEASCWSKKPSPEPGNWADHRKGSSVAFGEAEFWTSWLEQTKYSGDGLCPRLLRIIESWKRDLGMRVEKGRTSLETLPTPGSAYAGDDATAASCK